MYDIIIKNGTIINGTGEPMYRADIGIRDEKIIKIGDLCNEKSNIQIDASNRLICPGFIDVNNHSDVYWNIFQNSKLESLIFQGITTIIGGNCGSSLAPLINSHSIESIQKWANLKQFSINWKDMRQFLDTVERKKLSVNFATLTGHATLRRAILGDQERSLSPDELEFMAKELKESLKKGSLGMSSGLIFTHARNASYEELLSLAKIVKKYDGVYATHLRDEGNNFLVSVDEAVRIAQESNVKVHISHFKVMEKDNWNKMDEALALIEKITESGIDITFDIYPYAFTGSVLYTFLPAWISEGGRKMMIARLKDVEIRSKLVSEIRASGFDYANMEILISPLNKTMARRKIGDIALSQEKSVEEAIIDVLIASEGRVIVSTNALSEENIEKAILHPASMISTNGAGYSMDNAKTGENVHPRSFGAFPRIFSQYVLGKKIISWENAVKKMTSMPARKFGIERRGELKEKYFADIAIIDADKIQDLATLENPYQYSRGIDFLLINGKIVISEGKHTGECRGEVIRA